MLLILSYSQLLSVPHQYHQPLTDSPSTGGGALCTKELREPLSFRAALRASSLSSRVLSSSINVKKTGLNYPPEEPAPWWKDTLHQPLSGSLSTGGGPSLPQRAPNSELFILSIEPHFVRVDPRMSDVISRSLLDFLVCLMTHIPLFFGWASSDENSSQASPTQL